jgi:hypothetical protein
MGLRECCVVGCYCKAGLCSCRLNSVADAFTDPCTGGVNFGKSGQRELWQSLGGDLVLDQRNLVHRVGRMERDEGDQWYADGFADKHDDLHAELRRAWRHVRSIQCDGGGECRAGTGQRPVRIGEWCAGVV